MCKKSVFYNFPSHHFNSASVRPTISERAKNSASDLLQLPSPPTLTAKTPGLFRYTTTLLWYHRPHWLLWRHRGIPSGPASSVAHLGEVLPLQRNSIAILAGRLLQEKESRPSGRDWGVLFSLQPWAIIPLSLRSQKISMTTLSFWDI